MINSVHESQLETKVNSLFANHCWQQALPWWLPQHKPPF